MKKQIEDFISKWKDEINSTKPYDVFEDGWKIGAGEVIFGLEYLVREYGEGNKKNGG